MTTVCRGRGWSSNMDRGALRRPGEATTPVDDPEVELLMTAVQNLNLQDPNTSAVTLRYFEDQIKTVCLTGDVLKNFVQRLHGRSLEDRQFGMKAAAACGMAHTFEVDGVKLRAIFLGATQKDYEEYAQLQTANNAKFLNSVALLGEIFHRVRLNDGSPITILATPVMHYQDLLLSGEEHEMELFTTLLSVNGRKLLDCRAQEMEELLLRVRTTLMSRNLSGQCRCWLLLSLDLAANRYSPLPSALQAFYQVHLGATALSQLQRVDAGLTVETGAPPVSHSLLQTQPEADSKKETLERSNSDDSATPRKLSDGDLRHKIGRANKNADTSDTKPEQIKWKGGDMNNSFKGRNSEDRGRRFRTNGPEEVKSPSERLKRISSRNEEKKEEVGSWRSEPRDKEEEEKWGLGGANKVQGKKESWGHDDRFEKEDSFYGRQAPREEGVGRFAKGRDSGRLPSRRDAGGDSKRTPRVESGGVPKNREKNPGESKNAAVVPPSGGGESWD